MQSYVCDSLCKEVCIPKCQSILGFVLGTVLFFGSEVTYSSTKSNTTVSVFVFQSCDMNFLIKLSPQFSIVPFGEDNRAVSRRLSENLNG